MSVSLYLQFPDDRESEVLAAVLSVLPAEVPAVRARLEGYRQQCPGWDGVGYVSFEPWERLNSLLNGDTQSRALAAFSVTSSVGCLGYVPVRTDQTLQEAVAGALPWYASAPKLLALVDNHYWA